MHEQQPHAYCFYSYLIGDPCPPVLYLLPFIFTAKLRARVSRRRPQISGSRTAQSGQQFCPTHLLARCIFSYPGATTRLLAAPHLDCSAVRAVLCGFRLAVDKGDVSVDEALLSELQAPSHSRSSSWGVGSSAAPTRSGSCTRPAHCGDSSRALRGRVHSPSAAPAGAFTSGFRKVFVEEEGHTSRCGDCNENGMYILKQSCGCCRPCYTDSDLIAVH